jgi:hypothetical protein
MIHVDVKKLGNIPDGGGWRYVGRQPGGKNRAATPGKTKNAHHSPHMGHAVVHTVIDDHSRLSYPQVHDDWRDTCADLTITPKRIRPYRPQTNGKIERFHRTLADGWAYARQYATEAERRATLPAWLRPYKHHRPHSACGNQPSFTRLTNVPGQYT